MQCFYYYQNFIQFFGQALPSLFFLILECSKRLDYDCRVEIKDRSFNTDFDALDNYNRTTLNPLTPFCWPVKENVAVNNHGLRFYSRSRTQSHHYPFESPRTHMVIIIQSNVKGTNAIMSTYIKSQYHTALTSSNTQKQNATYSTFLVTGSIKSKEK